MFYSTSIISSRKEFKLLKPAWDSLIDDSDDKNLFLTFDWIDCWLDFFPQDCTLFIVLIYKEQQLIAIAPLYKAPIKILNAIPARVIRVLGDQYSSAEYQDLILDREHKEEALRKIGSAIKNNAKECLAAWSPFSDESTGAAARLEKVMTAADYQVGSRSIAFYRLPLPDNAKTYESRLKTKQRNNIRRYRKQLSGQENLRLKNLRDLMPPEEVFTVLENLHSQRWLSKGETGAFERNPKFREFLKAYTVRASKLGQIAAFCLFQGPKPIAIRFGFTYNNTMYEIQSGFDPSLNGAGLASIDMAIKAAISDHLEVYDFLAFEGEYKQRFGAIKKPGKRLFAIKNNLLGWLVTRAGLWPTGRYIQM